VIRTFVVVAVLAVAGFWSYEAAESPASQIFGKTVVSGPAGERVVALTFDDGPNPPYTDAILRVLEREGVRATFFVVGRAVSAYPESVRREVRDGDAVGNHSWSHEHLIVESPQRIHDSLARTDAAIFAAAHVHPSVMRPPFGSRDWAVLGEAQKLGYTPVMWSVPLANDWEYPPPTVIAQRIVPYVRDGSILVLHDGNRGLLCARDRLPARTCDRSSEVEATRLIVDALKRQGYRFVTVPELLALRPVTRTSVPGKE
jgi:peptidoglycan/xylan/chitin deacetylase (PgdA/CDA1 family)